MARLTVFENISLDGFFTDRDRDMSFAHGAPDPEFSAFVAGNARAGEGRMVFGRETYAMMERYWTTADAHRHMPEVARRMNDGRKIVFSRGLTRPGWANTEVRKGDVAAELRALKAAGEDLVILGSGSIVAQVAGAGVVDEYQFVIVPVVLGAGRTLFEGLAPPVGFRLRSQRAFPSGKIVACYSPAP